MTILLCKLLSKVLLFGSVQWFPGKRYFFDVRNCVIQKKPCSFISSGVLLKHKSTNFTLVEATFVWKERAHMSIVIPNGLYTYFLEEEATSLSVNTFEDLDSIVTKDASDDFTTDKKQKCSNNNSVLVTAWK